MNNSLETTDLINKIIVVHDDNAERVLFFIKGFLHMFDIKIIITDNRQPFEDMGINKFFCKNFELIDMFFPFRSLFGTKDKKLVIIDGNKSEKSKTLKKILQMNKEYNITIILFNMLEDKEKIFLFSINISLFGENRKLTLKNFCKLDECSKYLEHNIRFKNTYFAIIERDEKYLAFEEKISSYKVADESMIFGIVNTSESSIESDEIIINLTI
jgi:hypothetical protein